MIQSIVLAVIFTVTPGHIVAHSTTPVTNLTLTATCGALVEASPPFTTTHLGSCSAYTTLAVGPLSQDISFTCNGCPLITVSACDSVQYNCEPVATQATLWTEIKVMYR